MEMCSESTVVRGCETLELVLSPAPVLQLLRLGTTRAPQVPGYLSWLTPTFSLLGFLLMEAEACLLSAPPRPPNTHGQVGPHRCGPAGEL